MPFQSGSLPYGTPYSDWLKNWWLWWIGIPNNEHPFPNYDPKTCSVHQQGPVWYLPDVEPTGPVPTASVKYSCEIPELASRGITDAYTLFLPPLPVGRHVIEFSVTDHLAGPTSELIKRDGVYTVFVK
jgi:hypothetical protein